MSLINQVLRDLDARHASVERKSLPNEVRPLPAADRRRGVAVPAGVAVLMLAAAGVWAVWEPAAKPMPPIAAVAPLSAAVELPPPPLVIAPPAPPEPAPVVEEPAPALAVSIASVPQSLRMSSALAHPVTAPPAAMAVPAAVSSIDKQVRVGGHERAEAAYRKAATEHQQGRDVEALALLREALQQEPAHGNARQLLLSLLVERKQWPEAEAALREGLDLAPAHSPWAVALARIQVERGQSAQAWDTLLRYMPAGEKSADYLGFAGVLLQRLQRPADAVGYYEAALRLKPEARWWVGLGIALEGSNRAAEAREAFLRAQASSGLTPEMTALIERRLGASKP